MAASGLATVAGASNARAPGGHVVYPNVVPGTALVFPRDHGAHPQFRSEWWYITGSMESVTARRERMGFQVTFFRSRLDTEPANPSAFAAKQLLFAHVALSDPRQGHLLAEQRAARSGFDLAEASTTDLDVHIGDWSIQRLAAQNRFAVRVATQEFAFEAELVPTQPILEEGQDGFSRKGPSPSQASEYYSLPHLALSGTLARKGQKDPVEGEAWLDREWSSDYLAAEASGWDWCGLNLEGGAALMAFRIRQKSGPPLWAGATLRRADGTVLRFGPEAVSYTTQESWRSPRTGVTYPVGQRLAVGPYLFDLAPLLRDSELDSSLSTGAIYWEGLVRATPLPGLPEPLGPGYGYLELTGYDQPLKF
jgi:predicted secreted hydrolase